MGNHTHQGASQAAESDVMLPQETYKILDSHDGDLQVVGGIKVNNGTFTVSNTKGTITIKEATIVVPLTYNTMKKYKIGSEIDYIQVIREGGNNPGYLFTLNRCEITAVKLDTPNDKYIGLGQNRIVNGPHLLVCFDFKNISTEEETYKLYKTTSK